MKSFFHMAARAAVLILAVSCAEDPTEEGFFRSDEECSLSMDVGFTSFSPALDTRAATGGTPGNAIGAVNSLQVLFYSNEGTDGEEGSARLKYVFRGTPTTEVEGSGHAGDNIADGVRSGDFTFTRTDEERKPEDGPTPDSGISGASTQHMTFRLDNLQRGRYRIYVVANMPDEFDAANDAKTVTELRNYKLKWNAEDIAANNAMFGYFTEASEPQVDVIQKAAPVIGISGPLLQEQALHAWIKRAVSKVTVAFDGSKLEPEVRVYIKSVQLRDLPRTCSLGAVNTPGKADEEPKTVLFPDPDNESEETQLTSNGTITYSLSVGEDTNNVVYREEPYYPDFTGDIENTEQVKAWKQNVHNATTNALYFFENCQGTGTHEENDANGTYKPQTDTYRPDGDGSNGLPDDYDHGYQKDSKPYGTYVEVHAYYENDNLDNRTSGNIIYRFMLGKDVETDFDAERSIHYKLTLKFNGYANDVDWHIDYNDEPGNHTPETIYVSYNYNTPSILPFQFVGKKVVGLSAEITQNNWGPDDNTISHYTGTTVIPAGLATGFLSLRYDNRVRVGTGDGDSGEQQDDPGFDRQKDAPKVGTYWNLHKENETQTYLENSARSNKLKLNDDEGVDDKFKFDFTYRQNSDGDWVTNVNIPLYTRPLMIYKSTSYTGANPYYTTTRSAKVKLTYTFEDGTSDEMVVNVEQVHRIDNPSGIWRSSDNTEPFAVTLMQQYGPEAYSGAGVQLTGRGYEAYKSKGSWRAYIYKATGTDGNTSDAWFTLTSGNQRADAIGEYIQGLNGTNISFTYKPNSSIRPNDVRCGIIKIEYNDYTCTHLILVRQGYAPLRISNAANAPAWHTFNLYDNDEEVTHPCDAGSLFVRTRYTTSIRDDQSPTDDDATLSNNRNWFGTEVPTLYTTAGGTYNITTNVPSNNNQGVFPTSVSLPSSPYTKTGIMPDYIQYKTLKDASNEQTIDKLYGVLYADGATTTATNFNEATGCFHHDVVNGNGRTTKGMRGAFAYNSDNARQVFFPISATGFGRRKYGDNDGGRGALQYSFGNTFYSGFLSWAYSPLLYNLYTNEGAIYWMRGHATQANTGSSHASGDNAWDVNYKTYDFDFMDVDGNTRTLSLIRLVDN